MKYTNSIAVYHHVIKKYKRRPYKDFSINGGAYKVSAIFYDNFAGFS